MADKAYIVANKQQELDVLNKLEQKGVFWLGGRNATDLVPSENSFFNKFTSFPYVIIENEFIVWSPIEHLEDETVVYDGRKEEKMYKVTQEFMDELIEWRDNNNLDFTSGYTNMFIAGYEIQELPDIVDFWRTDADSSTENNNRLISILKWLNGEDVFEVEEPHKLVVRIDKTDVEGNYTYVMIDQDVTETDYVLEAATKFDTREEAQEWANSHQVVVEIDAEGNEVE